MKNLTKNILDFVSTKEFSTNNKNVTSKANEFGRGVSLPDGERTIPDIQVKIEEILDFFPNNEDIIDATSHSRRSAILNLLRNIGTYAQNINNGSNQTEQRANDVESLHDFISPSLYIENYVKGLESNIAKVQGLKSRYQNLIQQIDTIIKNQPIIEKFLTVKDEVLKIEEIKQTALSHQEEVQKFHDTLKNDIDDFENIIEQQTTKSEEIEQKTTELLDQNTVLQNKSSELLKNTVAGTASKEFKTKADDIKLWLWPTLILFCSFLGVLVIFWAFGGFEDLTIGSFHLSLKSIHIDTGNNNVLLFSFRVVLIIPFLVLDYFFYNQYEFYKKLKEQYSFKAIVAGTLDSYVSILKTHEDWQDYKEYIMEVTKDILKSPLEDVKTHSLTKKGQEFAEKTMDKAIDVLGKKAEKVMD